MMMEYSEQIISSKQIYQIFGNNVKAYRKAQNKTQEELAAALECDQKYVSRIETGRQNRISQYVCVLPTSFMCPLSFCWRAHVKCSVRQRTGNVSAIVRC